MDVGTSVSPSLTYHVIGLVTAMVFLLIGSAFFSASEAALFSLNWNQQAASTKKGLVDRTISHLLGKADRLLSTILFFNLTINVVYFSISTILANLAAQAQSRWTLAIPLLSLAIIILSGELIPKSLGVAAPMRISRAVAIPLSWAVAIANPITPIFQWVSDLSRRIIWPGMTPEQYLDVTDLERAIELSGSDASLIKHEKDMLQNTVQLSVVRIEEWMKPRSSFLCVELNDQLNQEINRKLGESATESPDYILVSNESQEVAAAIRLADLPYASDIHWREYVRPVLIVPWCQTLGDVFTAMQKSGKYVALVVNEFGESIGIATYEDLIESVFSTEIGDVQAFSRPAFDQTGKLQWEVTGSTSLRRIERALGRKLPRGRQVTVAGVLQTELQRLPHAGDIVQWGGFQIEVIRVPRRGEVLLRMTQLEPQEGGITG